MSDATLCPTLFAVVLLSFALILALPLLLQTLDCAVVKYKIPLAVNV